MYDYKCSNSRLARFFKDSRDKWKIRAEKYQEMIRSLKVKVRDLQNSRDHWKIKARLAEDERYAIEQEYNNLLAQDQNDKKESDSSPVGPEVESTTPRDAHVKNGESTRYNNLALVPDQEALQRPYGHMYPLFVMQFGIDQLINSFSSLRGCQHALESLLKCSVPSFTTIQNWVFRLGYYEVHRPREWRADRIYLIDMTIELGKKKCLLIVGIPQANLPIITYSSTGERSNSYAIRHQDIEVLAVEVLNNPTGEIIHQCIENLSQKIGPPLQIVSDHGSDIHKGIGLFLQNHEDTVYTYDVTHKMALLLKHELKDDERFQDFMGKCETTLRRVQQTELNCIKPPVQRTKSRYHNIDTHVKWAEAMFRYQARNDYSTFGTGFIMDATTFDFTWQILVPQSRSMLPQVPWKRYPTKQAFIDQIITHLGDKLSEQNIEQICKVADEGQRRFEEYFDWIAEYKNDIALYSQFIEIVNVAEKQIKNEGLNCKSKMMFEESIAGKVFLPRAKCFKDSVVDYLLEEGGQIPKGQVLLGTSDILESIIGKYKQFSARSPLREIGKRILAIPLFGVDIVSGLVRKAMEIVRETDVDNWAKRTFGKSSITKRRELLGKTTRNRTRMKNDS
jgi:hypothetical protein